MPKTSDTYHHGDLKTAMIKAALDLVREKGPRGFTLNEASRVAGVSKSAPYRHFRDKDALLAEIALIGTRLLESELRAASSRRGTPREKLLSALLGYIEFAQNHPDYFAVMFQSG
ncbi:MAG: TetR/AcrR family transcriptional regulator, partial [Janthinobacterium lividum]